jgi:hypothetical protein
MARRVLPVGAIPVATLCKLVLPFEVRARWANARLRDGGYKNAFSPSLVTRTDIQLIAGSRLATPDRLHIGRSPHERDDLTRRAPKHPPVLQRTRADVPFVHEAIRRFPRDIRLSFRSRISRSLLRVARMSATIRHAHATIGTWGFADGVLNERPTGCGGPCHHLQIAHATQHAQESAGTQRWRAMDDDDRLPRPGGAQQRRQAAIRLRLNQV